MNATETIEAPAPWGIFCDYEDERGVVRVGDLAETLEDLRTSHGFLIYGPGESDSMAGDAEGTATSLGYTCDEFTLSLTPPIPERWDTYEVTVSANDGPGFDRYLTYTAEEAVAIALRVVYRKGIDR